jgi:hypothetical protein
MGNFKARESRALKLPIPPGLSGRILKLMVLEGEFRMVTVG